MKKAAAAILCGAMLAAASADAACTADMNTNGGRQNNIAQTMNANGIPVRGLLESLGMEVDFDNGCVKAQNSSSQVCLRIGCKEITINGETVSLDEAPFIEQGSTYLPVKAIMDVLRGCNVRQSPAPEQEQKPDVTPAADPTAAPAAAPTVRPTAAPAAAPTVRPTAAPTAAPAVSSERDMEKRVLTLVNNVRSQYGLGALTWAEDLAQVARAHSSDMIRRGFFDHTNPDGRSPFDRLKAAGISYRTAAENIAYGQRTPEEVMNAWMNSSGHRANILNANVKEMGVGAVKNNNGTVYWTQMFVAR